MPKHGNEEPEKTTKRKRRKRGQKADPTYLPPQTRVFPQPRDPWDPLNDSVYGRSIRDKQDPYSMVMVRAEAGDMTPFEPVGFYSPGMIKRVASVSGQADVTTSGLVQTPQRRRPRREAAAFKMLVYDASGYREAFRLGVWKPDHKTPVAKKVGADIRQATIESVNEEKPPLVPVEEKRFEITLTQQELKKALEHPVKGRDQGRVMAHRGRVSAAAAVKEAYGIDLSDKEVSVDFEWSHLVAHRFAAEESQVSNNLVATTKYANSQMLDAVEAPLQRLIQEYPDVKVKLTVSADVKPGTHIAEAIYYDVQFENGNGVTFVFDPFAREKTSISLKHFGFELLKQVMLNPREVDKVEPRIEAHAVEIKNRGLFAPKPKKTGRQKRRQEETVEEEAVKEEAVEEEAAQTKSTRRKLF